MGKTRHVDRKMTDKSERQKRDETGVTTSQHSPASSIDSVPGPITPPSPSPAVCLQLHLEGPFHGGESNQKMTTDGKTGGR
mmetsp:Transcript_29198/g.57270  ORF Transcript_29198/g.57270 Transcript_29198/m.57270 type:complete len:81 (+) Transcript_29198:1060-1302(+)